MNLGKLDRQLLWATITLAAIDVGMVVAALTVHPYYDAFRTPIIILTVVSLIACFIGYTVNKKYLEQPE